MTRPIPYYAGNYWQVHRRRWRNRIVRQGALRRALPWTWWRYYRNCEEPACTRCRGKRVDLGERTRMRRLEAATAPDRELDCIPF